VLRFQEEHQKRWGEYYRNSQPSIDDSSPGPPLSERDIWVQVNQDSKGCVYDFGSESSKMKSMHDFQFRLSHLISKTTSPTRWRRVLMKMCPIKWRGNIEKHFSRKWTIWPM